MTAADEATINRPPGPVFFCAIEGVVRSLAAVTCKRRTPVGKFPCWQTN